MSGRSLNVKDTLWDRIIAMTASGRNTAAGRLAPLYSSTTDPPTRPHNAWGARVRAAVLLSLLSLLIAAASTRNATVDARTLTGITNWFFTADKEWADDKLVPWSVWRKQRPEHVGRKEWRQAWADQTKP